MRDHIFAFLAGHSRGSGVDLSLPTVLLANSPGPRCVRSVSRLAGRAVVGGRVRAHQAPSHLAGDAAALQVG